MPGLPDLKPGSSRLGLLQQGEAALLDHRVGEAQLGDGPGIHNLLHRVSTQETDHLHSPASTGDHIYIRSDSIYLADAMTQSC